MGSRVEPRTRFRMISLSRPVNPESIELLAGSSVMIWAQGVRVASRVSLPGEWPLMLVEIFHREDGQISMTCALGVPKSSLKAFLAQGAYLYEFQELPAAIVGVLDAHFAQVGQGLATKIEAIAPTFKS